MRDKVQQEMHLVSAAILEYMVNTHEEQKKTLPTAELWTKFHAKSVPNITLTNYMTRIHKHTECSESCYIVALIYMDRVLKSNKLLVLSKYNVHRY